MKGKRGKTRNDKDKRDKIGLKMTEQPTKASLETFAC